MLPQSVMFGFLEDPFLKDQPFVFSVVFFRFEIIKKKTATALKTLFSLINVNEVRLEVRKCSSVNLAVITTKHKVAVII